MEAMARFTLWFEQLNLGVVEPRRLCTLARLEEYIGSS